MRQRTLPIPHLRHALIGVVLALSAAPTMAPAQNQSPPPPSATLLRRLAESADAYRTGDTVFFVASTVFPNRVVGGFSSRATAAAIAHTVGPTYYVYATQTSPTTPIEAFSLPCYKNTRTTAWVCDSSAPSSQVVEIAVMLRLRDGRTLTRRLSPDSAGVVTFTLEAFDKFIVPYYTRLFGPAYAAQMRDSVVAQAERTALH